jgi:predicted transcriptional regulator YheO
MTGPRQETLQPLGAETLRARIDEFAARVAATPRSLKASDRRKLVQELKDTGQLEVRRAMEIIAAHLGVSRATIYADAR